MTKRKQPDFVDAWRRQGQEAAAAKREQAINLARKSDPYASEEEIRRRVAKAENDDRSATEEHQRRYIQGLRIANGEINLGDHE